MALPVSINSRIGLHLLRARASGRGPRIPLVLMLELTHACNLHCAGCGRIREYADTRTERLDFEQAMSAITDAAAPVLSISGGEPLLHPEVPAIAGRALQMGKVVYLCTNGLLLERRLPEFAPIPRFYFNVHLDGWIDVHDRLVGLQGAAQRAMEGIRAAKAHGFGVTTNTTIYRDTSVASVVQLFTELTAFGVDGLMIAPAFAYEVGTEAATLSRAEAQAWMRQLRSVWGERNLYHTPLYMQFLRGERSLSCLPWGTVTYNPQGWKKPCYLLTDGHARSFGELMADTDWGAYGPGQDPRCADCMLHSGFEPSVMTSMRGPGDWMRMIRWQFQG